MTDEKKESCLEACKRKSCVMPQRGKKEEKKIESYLNAYKTIKTRGDSCSWVFKAKKKSGYLPFKKYMSKERRDSFLKAYEVKKYGKNQE